MLSLDTSHTRTILVVPAVMAERLEGSLGGVVSVTAILVMFVDNDCPPIPVAGSLLLTVTWPVTSISTFVLSRTLSKPELLASKEEEIRLKPDKSWPTDELQDFM